jgi:membrane-associated phospholipid phosphatase
MSRLLKLSRTNTASSKDHVTRPDGDSPELPVVSQRTYLMRQSWMRPLLYAVCVLLLALIWTIQRSPVLQVDIKVSQYIQRLQEPFPGALLRLISQIGDLPQAVILTVVVGLVCVLLRRPLEGLMSMASPLGGVAVSESLKTMIDRPRPTTEYVTQYAPFLRQDSFPSGHVFFFVAFFGFLLYLIMSLLPQSWYRSLAGIFLVLLIILIGVARIYLGAHWLTDTLGAYLVGCLWLVCVIFVYHHAKEYLK